MSGGARSYVAAALVSQFDSEEGGCQECTILTDSNVRCVHFHASLSRAPSRTYTASSLSSTTPPTTSLAAEVAEARKSITLAIRRATSAEARIASLKARCERHKQESHKLASALAEEKAQRAHDDEAKAQFDVRLADLEGVNARMLAMAHQFWDECDGSRADLIRRANTYVDAVDGRETAVPAEKSTATRPSSSVGSSSDAASARNRLKRKRRRSGGWEPGRGSGRRPR